MKAEPRRLWVRTAGTRRQPRKQPGHFWINLRTTDRHRRFSLPDLTFHEAIPGHVWQGEFTFKQPLIRSLLAFNAYAEGWALYAEQLADELGVYDDFPAVRLGYLQSLAFRACRLVGQRTHDRPRAGGRGLRGARKEGLISGCHRVHTFARSSDHACPDSSAPSGRVTTLRLSG